MGRAMAAQRPVPAPLPLLLLLLGASRRAAACSNFRMENGYGISVRTKDLGGAHTFAWRTVPRGVAGELARRVRYGYIGAMELGGGQDGVISAGLNEAGLSCDTQTLVGTVYQNRTGDPAVDLRSLSVCQWALQNFATAAEVREALRSVSVWGDCAADPSDCKHVHVADDSGAGVTVEWLRGAASALDDGNDGGRTGFGVMTNEPPIDWQIDAVRHTKWKMALARSAVPMPGEWYPDARFQRAWMVKSAMPLPATHREAMMQAVHVLNTVTVPMGLQRGTDSGAGSGEGAADRTLWGVIYDHANRTVYWRGEGNQNLQRLRLADAALAEGSAPAAVGVENDLPWFADAAAALRPA